MSVAKKRARDDLIDVGLVIEPRDRELIVDEATSLGKRFVRELIDFFSSCSSNSKCNCQTKVGHYLSYERVY